MLDHRKAALDWEELVTQAAGLLYDAAPSDAVKSRTLKGFGSRLAHVRQDRGLTQAELGKAVGVSQRVIAYYETESQQPPGALLADLATALEVSTDELLGLKAVAEKRSPRRARLLKRLQKIEDLPAVDQRIVLRLLDALHAARARTGGRSRARVES